MCYNQTVAALWPPERMSVFMQRHEIWKIIDERQEDLIRFYQDIIRIPSENPPGDVEDVTKFICDFLDTYHTIMRSSARCLDAPTSGHLQAKGGKRVVFNGHCDVVPPETRANGISRLFRGDQRRPYSGKRHFRYEVRSGFFSLCHCYAGPAQRRAQR